METFAVVILGIVLIAIGISNRKGNIHSLHSYHRKRVSEEDRLPFGKLVGTGMIIIGVCMLISGILGYAGMPEAVSEGIAIGGLVIGLAINFYAMIKYNKGIF